MSLGAWMGTIMLFNVWVLIWPNQKKVLGIVEASADEIAKAKITAAMASLASGTDQVKGEGLTFQSLFFVGLLLFAITFMLNMVADRFVRRVQERY